MAVKICTVRGCIVPPQQWVPFAQRLHGGTAKLFTDDEAKVREAIALWEQESGVRAEILG
jgi:hypothetical protein